ncbi:hypothetical protein Tco_1458792 [Tanacetum coccineum]
MEIITFYQKPNDAFNEAWERFKGLLRQCPHHGFSELHQLDTFYNSLNSNDQDALDSAAGGNFLDKMPQEGLAIIESKSKVRYSRSRASVQDRSSSTIDIRGADPFLGCSCFNRCLLNGENTLRKDDQIVKPINVVMAPSISNNNLNSAMKKVNLMMSLVKNTHKKLTWIFRFRYSYNNPSPYYLDPIVL